jgi:frataxin-like iron-binding protein CyaY
MKETTMENWLPPMRPWVASNQYGMHFILSQNNEIVMRADHIPMVVLKAMVEAANAIPLQPAAGETEGV